MAHFDVFNGDADGICALHQLRLAAPREATLVTGAKREIALVARAGARRGDSMTVLDVSFDTNRAAVQALLEAGVEIEYFDHHFAGDIPHDANLTAHIDTAADVCTSVLVDRHLHGRYRLWAITAAWGDNLPATARKLAEAHGLSADAAAQLRELGDSINYNAYGDDIEDLLIEPAALYETLHAYENPFDFIASAPLVRELAECRHGDMARARETSPLVALPCGSVHLLPDAPWARRVRGVFANALATDEPMCAHAVLSARPDGGYAVSVRAPIERLRGADQLCRDFPGGNGRVGAAGIDRLAPDKLDAFAAAFARTFGNAV